MNWQMRRKVKQNYYVEHGKERIYGATKIKSKAYHIISRNFKNEIQEMIEMLKVSALQSGMGVMAYANKLSIALAAQGEQEAAMLIMVAGISNVEQETVTEDPDPLVIQNNDRVRFQKSSKVFRIVSIDESTMNALIQLENGEGRAVLAPMEDLIIVGYDKRVRLWEKQKRRIFEPDREAGAGEAAKDRPGD